MRKMIDVNSDLDAKYRRLFPGMGRTYIFNELLRNFLDHYEEFMPDYHDALRVSARKTSNKLLKENEED